MNKELNTNNPQLAGQASGYINLNPNPYYGGWQGTYSPSYNATIQQVSNGFIVNLDGNQHVYETVESMLQALAKRFKKDNK